MNIAQMVETAGVIAVNNEVNANTTNTKAYTSPANMNQLSVLEGKSVMIEPSEDGVPEPPSGGAAPKTKIPGSPKLEGARGTAGARPEGKSRTGETKSFGSEGHEESKSISDKGARNIEHAEHTEHKQPELDVQQNQSEKKFNLKDF